MRHVAVRCRWVVQTMNRFLAGCAVGLLLAASPAWSVEPPSESMDCRVYETKKTGTTIGLKAGNLLFNIGPEVTFSNQTGIAWDRTVQGLIAKYVELCTRYNAGLATKEEYDARLREIEALYKEAQELERKLMEETRTRAKSAVDELDRALAQRKTAEPQTADPIKVSLEDLNRRIESIDIKKKSTKGKRPSDAMGTMGREKLSPEAER